MTLNTAKKLTKSQKKAALCEFVLSTITGTLKPAEVKRARSKYPTGRGEQKQSAQWFHRDEWDISLTKLMATENRKPSITEGFAEIESYDVGVQSIHRMSDTEAEVWEKFQEKQAEHEAYCDGVIRDAELRQLIAEADYDIEAEPFITSPSDPRYLVSEWDCNEGDPVIFKEEQSYLTRQECGSLFEDDEDSFMPPSVELRFDNLGTVAARNIYLLNPKMDFLTKSLPSKAA